MKNQNYEPFGIEWRKEVMKLPVDLLVKTFEIPKHRNESKLDYVRRVQKIKLDKVHEIEESDTLRMNNKGPFAPF